MEHRASGLRAAVASIVLIALQVPESGLAQRAAAARPGAPDSLLRKETIALGPPANCAKPSFQIVTLKEGDSPELVSFLQSLGMAVKGVTGGSGAKVTCDQGSASGWVDDAGDLRSLINPAEFWFAQCAKDVPCRQVGGALELVTQRLLVNGTEEKVTYAVYVGQDLSEYSTRLLRMIGLGIRGVDGPVKLRFEDGLYYKGVLHASGAVTGGTERWK